MPPPVGLLSATKEFVNDAVGDVVATGEVRLDWSACPGTCPSLLGCEVSSSDPLAPNPPGVLKFRFGWFMGDYKFGAGRLGRRNFLGNSISGKGRKNLSSTDRIPTCSFAPNITTTLSNILIIPTKPSNHGSDSSLPTGWELQGRKKSAVTISFGKRPYQES